MQLPDYVDVLLACDIKFNQSQTENLIAQYAWRDIQELTAQAKQAQINQLKPQFDQHVNNLKSISYAKLLQKVTNARNELISANLSDAYREKVANKLEELADNRITAKENAFGGLHRFFHKIFQALQGHGFQTKAEYGKQIAKELKESSSKNLEMNIAEWMRGIVHPSGEEIKKVLNEMPSERFVQLLNSAVFPIIPRNWAGEKYVLYQLLTDEKKAIFRQQLSERRNLIGDIRTIGGITEAQELISSLPAEPFQKLAPDLGKRIKQDKADPYDLLGLTRAIQGWIAAKTPGPIAKLVTLGEGTRSCRDLQATS
jgi:hypothetical protein